MESDCRVCSDDDELDIEDNPFCIESSHPQHLESTYYESFAEEDGEGNYINNHVLLVLDPILPSFYIDTCENCQDLATIYCDQCSNKYCNVCSALRHKHSSRSGHRLMPLSNDNISVKNTLEITGTYAINHKFYIYCMLMFL